MQVISTSFGDFQYEPISLYYGRKLIDKDNARRNLLQLKEVLNRNGVDFGIIYGTLLGAVRENDFIEYDEDVDVFILDEFRNDFLKLLFILKEVGFEVARYEGDLLSIIRDDDYIDIYFFKKNINGRRCNGDFIPKIYFEEFDQIEFLGVNFLTFRNKIGFLEYAYGKTWHIPIKNKPASVKGLDVKLKQFIKIFVPPVLVDLLNKIRGKQ